MDCRFRKLSLLSCQLLSAVGSLVTHCRHILTQCRLSLKPLGRPHSRLKSLGTPYWVIHEVLTGFFPRCDFIFDYDSQLLGKEMTFLIPFYGDCIKRILDIS